MDNRIQTQRAPGSYHAGGGENAFKNSTTGKYTARERIEKLLPGTFIEIDAFVEHRCTEFDMATPRRPARAVTGYGQVDGRPSMFTPRTLRLLAARSARCTQPKSAR